MSEEYQLESDYNEDSVDLEDLRVPDNKYDKMVDFASSLSKEEGEYIRKFALSNKDSELEIKDYKDALRTFRLERAKNFKGITLEEKLKNAVSADERGKILTEAGLNPIEKKDPFDLKVPDREEPELGHFGPKPLYDPEEKKEADEEIKNSQKIKSLFSEALDHQDRVEKKWAKQELEDLVERGKKKDKEHFLGF